MKLTLKQLKPLFPGVLHMEQEGDCINLFRFTNEQLKCHENSGDLYLGALNTPVALDFYTDAQTVRLKVGGWREGIMFDFSFELLQDCVMTQVCRHQVDLSEEEWVEVPPMEMEFTLRPGEKRVTVYFPWALAAKIYAVELPDGASVRPCSYKGRWLALGDSITHGAKAVHSSMTYVNQTARHMDLQLVNQGIGGEVFHTRNYQSGVLGDFDLITVAYGTNDFSRGKSQFFTEMPAFLKSVAEDNPKTPVVVILPLFRRMEALDMDKGIGTMAEVREKIAAEAKKYENIKVVNGWDLVPHAPQYFEEDYMLHPNDLGFSQYAMNLCAVLRKMGFEEAAV